nr:hypothetical protein HUO10_002013 [Paraburkholderia busanensis]
MTVKKFWLDVLQEGAPRFAAGIDVGSQNVRLVIVSHRALPEPLLKIEYVRTVPLAPGAMAGNEIVDRLAVTRALREAFDGLPRACTAQTLCCAMAVPSSAMMFAAVPLALLTAKSGCADDGGFELSDIEPAVMTEIEGMTGLERHALAVDWFIADGLAPVRSVIIAATARPHLEARMECAAAAGISLTAVDGEPQAALRALRYAARCELDSNEPFIAVWIGTDGVYGWRICEEELEHYMRYPAPEHSDLADALRDLADGCAARCAFVGGEIDLLEGVGFSIADIADVLGCPVRPLDIGALDNVARPLTDALLHEPDSAVAFGLALRGVCE